MATIKVPPAAADRPGETVIHLKDLVLTLGPMKETVEAGPAAATETVVRTNSVKLIGAGEMVTRIGRTKVNSVAQLTNLTLTPNALDDNDPIGTVVGTVQRVGAPLATLSIPAALNPLGYFAIDANTGVITTLSVLPAATYNIWVRGDDGYFPAIDVQFIDIEVTAIPLPPGAELTVTFDDTAPVVFDNDASGTLISPVSVVVEGGGAFSGTLAFKENSGTDLTISATNRNSVKSASFSFAELLVYGTDLELILYDITNWRVRSLSTTFTADCVGRSLETLAGSAAPWNKTSSNRSFCWQIKSVNGNTADLVHLGSSTNIRPTTNSSPTSNGAEFRVARNYLVGQKIEITGGTGFIPGIYTIIAIGVDGPNASAILDRSPGAVGSTGGQWSMVHDAGGQYEIVGSDVKATAGLRAGDNWDLVKVVATQGATTGESLPLKIARISTDARAEFFISESVEQATGLRFHQKADEPWNNANGDWVDALGVPQGTTAYAQVLADPDNDQIRTLTFNILNLVNEVAALDPEIPLEIMVTSSQPRSWATRDHATEMAPKIAVTYSDASTDTLYDLADVQLSGSSQVALPFDTTIGTTNGTPIKMPVRFQRPNPLKTVTVATLSLRLLAQTGGNADIKIYRVRQPQVLPSVELGIANGAVADAGLAAHASVVRFFDCTNAIGTDFLTSALDNTNPTNFDYSGGVGSKFPVLGFGQFITDAAHVPPSVIDGSYTANNYYPLHASSPNAWMIDCPANRETALDARLFFKTTATGDQVEAWTNGNTPAARKTSNIAPAFSTTSGSAIVTVRDVAHGAAVGDWVNFATMIAVGGTTLLSGFVKFYQILTVPTADTYTVTSERNATANVTNGGAVGSFNVSGVGQTVATITLAAHGLYPTMNFNTQTGNFTNGQTITGGTSGTTAILFSHTDSGSIGLLSIHTITGTGFVSGETITDPLGGSAKVGTHASGLVLMHPVYRNGVSVTVGGLVFGVSDSFGNIAFNEASATADTFKITKSSGTATGAATVLQNSGNAQIKYLGGTLKNGLPDGKLPQELYVRWYMMLAPDFMTDQPTVKMGGKWSFGLSHRTRLAGNGGNPANSPAESNGKKGWSSRNNWWMSEETRDPMYGTMLFGTYEYNMLPGVTGFQAEYMSGVYGAIRRGKWYCIEKRLKMNTYFPDNSSPSVADAIVEMWIDGRKVMSHTNFQYRANPPWMELTDVTADLGIKDVWVNCFDGGVWGGFPMANHHFVKNLVISKAYVGPMKMA